MKNKTTSVWWKHGIVYQIYPRSFFDTNGDGIGDIPGITAKLDYLADLGVDAIWLSPVNESPMYDFGYDISDYQKIDSIFGTQSDFDELLQKAHQKGMRVILDLVINHTSHLHAWFLESASSRDNPKSDWYIWHEGRRKKPPNNWKSAFGGSGWEWDPRRRQYYFHSFLKEQPDLNWRETDVKKAVFDMVRFWLKKGVDGFRLDVVNCFFKDDRLRMNPFFWGSRPRPYDLQKHIYDRNRPEMHDLLREFRLVLEEFPDRMSIGEILAEKPGDPAMAATFLGNGENELHLTFDFSMLYSDWDPAEIFQRIEKWYSCMPENGWPSITMNNHDYIRSVSRYAKGKETMPRARVLAALILTLRGTPFLYYGEEIGMGNLDIRRKEIQDPVGRRYWPFDMGRDGERTPMQWSGASNAGFSANKPWLRICDDYKTRNVESGKNDPASLLNFYKELIRLRRAKPVLSHGDWAPLKKGGGGVIAYYRTFEKKRIIVTLNFTNRDVKIHTPEYGNWKIIFSTHKPPSEEYISLNFTMHAYEVSIFEEVLI